MCGVVGIVGRSAVNQELYDALIGLQHRGQDAAGMVISNGSKLTLRKDNGLVSQVFEERHMRKLAGTMGIGHVRYPTAGSSSSAEAQPMYVNSPYGISLGHNGNLTNATELKRDLEVTAHRHLNTNSDSEILLNVFAHELQMQNAKNVEPEQVFRAVEGVMRRCRGAFAVVALIIGGGIVGFRDPRGIRPLALGRKEGALFTEYMLASESSALEVLNFEFVRDVLPGEAVYITTEGEMFSQKCVENAQHTPCIFEYVYLARQDSIIDDISVYHARLNMGENLVEQIIEQFSQHDHDIDIVIPIPDTSRTAAVPVADNLNVKYSDAFVKNNYIGRTFIMPGQSQRQKSVRQKLNAISDEFRGRNVLLVEDSIVRGTTTREIVQQARSAGAKKVYLAVAAPPVRFPNVFGIDMPTSSELVANGRSEEEIARFIDVDKLIYQSHDGLVEAVTRLNPSVDGFECSIFNGEYQCNDVDEEYLTKLSRERSDVSKKRYDSGKQDYDSVIEIYNVP